MSDVQCAVCRDMAARYANDELDPEALAAYQATGHFPIHKPKPSVSSDACIHCGRSAANHHEGRWCGNGTAYFYEAHQS